MTPSDDEESLSYTAKRVDDRDLDAIYEHNLRHLDRWTRRYPNHGTWIRSTIQSIRRDDYSRLAFGVFIHGGEHTGKLACSAIVKKDHLGSYLKIKNLVLLYVPEGLSHEKLQRYKNDCYKKMLQHIQGFAESRGYLKLVTELLNRDDDDRELIQAFLRRGFDVAGSQTHRYRDRDEVIYLSLDVHPVYRLDPYDFKSATKWLIKRHIPEFEVEDPEHDGSPARNITFLVNGKREFTRSCLELTSHRRESDSLSVQKFSSSCYVLVIESYLASVKGVSFGDRIEPVFEFDTRGRVYVFDFSLKPDGRPTLWEQQLFPKIKEREKNSAYFDRNELNLLLYREQMDGAGRAAQRWRVAADLPLDEIGGLLTLTDPARLDCSQIDANQRAGITSIYIKLGPKGRHATQGQLLAFYFPSTDSSSHASIWAYAEVTDVQYLDLNRDRIEGSGQPSDGEHLFRKLDEMALPDDPPAQPLWKVQTFDKHNKYNATNEVVCFYLSNFVDLRTTPLPLEQVICGNNREAATHRRKSIVKEIDAYISIDEAEIIRNSRGAAVAPSAWQLPEPPYKVMCIYSSPSDQSRIEFEGNEIGRILEGRRQFRLLPPAINVDHIALCDAMRASPDILHVSSHGTRDGLTFAGENGSWTLTPKALELALAKGNRRPFLIVLNSCKSADLARKASGKCFAIGFRGELSHEHADAFTRAYLTGLVGGFASASVLRARLLEITRSFEFQYRGVRPVAWFDGDRVEDSV